MARDDVKRSAESDAADAFEQWAETGAVPEAYLESVLGQSPVDSADGSVSPSFECDALNRPAHK